MIDLPSVKPVKKILELFNNFIDTYEKEYEFDLSQRESELLDNVKGLYQDFVDLDYACQNKELEVYKCELIDIINEFNSDVEESDKKRKYSVSAKVIYNRTYTKLNYIFRKQKILTAEEARDLYINKDFLIKKYQTFIDLIAWINDNNIAIIPEKTLFSAYLGISVDIYNDFLKGVLDVDIQPIFKSIDEYFTTSQFGALINEDKKSLERIQKTKNYGQEMEQIQPEGQIVIENKELTFEDIMKKASMWALPNNGNKEIIDCTPKKLSHK